MTITPIKTRLIKSGDDLLDVITEKVDSLAEESVIAIASKAFSFSEKRLVPVVTGEPEEKWKLAREEAEFYMDPNQSKYQLMFTIKGNWVWANAGVDESNSQGHYTLWPKNPQDSVNILWQRLKDHYSIKNFGIVMTDSKSFPLNWGVVGHAIAYCGFNPIKDYRGTKDLDGRILQMEQSSLVQAMASVAAMEMGEGAEQQPLAIISDISQDMQWLDHPPTKKELDFVNISIEDDAFAPMITAVDWKKGGTIR